jgi:hypothetical protein
MDDMTMEQKIDKMAATLDRMMERIERLDAWTVKNEKWQAKTEAWQAKTEAWQAKTEQWQGKTEAWQGKTDRCLEDLAIAVAESHKERAELRVLVQSERELGNKRHAQVISTMHDMREQSKAQYARLDTKIDRVYTVLSEDVVALANHAVSARN